eukprot:1049011-Rhodomonas_salina.1
MLAPSTAHSTQHTAHSTQHTAHSKDTCADMPTCQVAREHRNATQVNSARSTRPAPVRARQHHTLSVHTSKSHTRTRNFSAICTRNSVSCV